MSLIAIGTVLAEHSMLLLLKNLTIEGQKNCRRCFYCSTVDVDRRGCSCWVGVWYGIEVREESIESMTSAMCRAFEQLCFCSRLKGQKTQLLSLLQPCYRFYAQLKVQGFIQGGGGRPGISPPS